MLMRVVALFFALLVWAGGVASAQFAFPAPVAQGEDFGVELGVMLWQPTPDLKLQTGPVVEGVVPADVSGLLGLERRRMTEYRLALKPARNHRFRISFMPVRYGQASTPDSPLVFGEATFPAGEPVTADVRWDLWRLSYQYDLASTERALVGVIFEARRSRVAAALESAGQEETLDATVTAPGFGFIVRGYVLRNVAVSLELSGFGLPGLIGRWVTDDDLDATTRDLDFSVLANATRHLAVQGGYRRVRTDFLVEGHRQAVKANGWYIGGLVRL